MKTRVKTFIGLGVVLMAGAVCLIVATIFIVHRNIDGHRNQFIIPGSLEFEAREIGRHYLCHDYRTVFDGKTFNLEESVPTGLTIHLRSKENDSLLDFFPDDSMTIEKNSSKSKSIGYFEIESRGSYLLTVSGESSERVFSFGRSKFGQTIFGIFAGFGFSILLGCSGAVLILLGVIKILDQKKIENQASLNDV